MKRRILSSLMALVLVFGLLPVSAMAEAGNHDPLTKSSAIKGTIMTGMSQTASTTKAPGDVELRIMPTMTSGNTTYNAMAYCGVEVVSSNPEVAAVKLTNGHQDIVIGKWQGGDWNGADCLQLNVEAKKPGTAVITTTFYYTFSQNNDPFYQGSTWFKGTHRYTVRVVDPDANKPDKPTVSDIERFRNYVNTTSSSKGAVYMWCDTYDHHAWFDYVTEVEDAYTLGEVVKNDGSVLSASTYPWICVMTLDANKYLDAYNSELGNEYGTHYLKDGQDATETATWYYNIELSKWQYRSTDAPVYINITHTAPTPEPDVPNTPNGDQIIADLGDAVKGAVKVECVNKIDAEAAETYDLTAGNIGSITKPTKNPEGKYTVNVTIEADEYVTKYSTDTGVSHNLKTGAASSQTITLTYNAAGGKWEATGTAPYVTFKVEHEGIPAQPDVNEIYKGGYSDPDGNPYVGEGGSEKFAVILKCNKDTKHIYGFNSLGLVDGGYTLGNVEPNTGANKTDYPYTCTMTVYYTKYMEQANKDIQEKHPADGEHEIVAGTETTREIVWYYNRTSKSWSVLAENDRAPIVIPVTCEKAPDEGMLETAVENAKLYVDCETVDSHGRQAIALNGYNKTTVTTKPYTVARTDKTATVTITDQKAYADQYKPGGAAHTYDSGNQSNRNTFNMEWKKGADGWNWYLKGEPALIMTTCTPKPTDDDVKTALDGLEKDVRVTCVTKKNNHGSETYAVKLGLPENWRLGEETNWNGHIGYEVEAPTSSFVKLFISKHGTHTVKNGMPETLRWVIYWDGSSWKAAANDNPVAIEVEHVNAPDTYQVTVKNSAATNSGAGFYEADKTVTIHAGSRSNYTFIGWTTSSGVTFANAAKADTTFKMPAKAVEVTANWKYTGSDSDNDKDDDYTLKYVTNGGKVISSETKSRSWVKDYEDLPTPIRSGYRFEGWYYDTRLTDKVTDDVKVNKTVVTLYARWSSSETPGMLNDEDHFAYVQGYSDGNVHPYGLISRAETTTIFFRLLTDEVRDDNLLTSNTYTDVTNDYWANTAISTMTGLGIVQGRSATTFDPKAPITRAQFAAICARFDTGVSSGSRTFSDISGHWAEKYIERAAELGWIQGFADGTFRPDTYITRAQAMTMINRVLNRTPEDEEDLLEGMKVWPDCNPGDWFYLAVQEATNSHDYKDRGGEVWTKLIRDPDWTRYER